MLSRRLTCLALIAAACSSCTPPEAPQPSAHGTLHNRWQETPDDSATVLLSGTTGVPEVRIEGLPAEVVTDRTGAYAVTLPKGWSGTVKPVRQGYTFEPQSRTYSAMDHGQSHQDYQFRCETLAVSGSVGIQDVRLTGLPGGPFTGPDGCYSAAVPYGWAGRVRPEKAGWTFRPEARDYLEVLQDLPHEHYLAQSVQEGSQQEVSDLNIPVVMAERDGEPSFLILSGRFSLQGIPIERAEISASNGGTTTVTDPNGDFEVNVPYNWTGDLTLNKNGLFIRPNTWHFANVTHNLRVNPLEAGPDPNQYPWPTAPYPTESKAGQRRTLIAATQDLEPKAYAELQEDLLVMAQILQDRINGPACPVQARGLYIQDYGALFWVPTDLILTRPQTEPLAGDPNDSIWDQTRRRLLTDPNQAGDLSTLGVLDRLIEALKQAIHLRHVPDHAWITVSVQGPIPSKTLTVRVRRHLIDDLAQAVLAPDAFREKIDLCLY